MKTLLLIASLLVGASEVGASELRASFLLFSKSPLLQVFPPMDSATILQSVEDYLKPLLADEKGLLSIAETEEDAIEMLANGSERWRVILIMDGDEAVEDFNPGGFVAATLQAWVQAPKGMEARPGRGLHRQGTNATPAFMTRLHWVIRKIRGLQLVHDEIDRRGFHYQGWNWLRFEETAAFRTARARFILRFAHDDPATDPDGTEPVTLPSAFRITGATDEFYTIALAGAAHGRIPRYEAGAEDPTGTATGYAVTSAGDDFYTVALDGVPHGRIPRFES